MNNEFNINNFLNLNDLEQKDYILSLDTNEFIKINEIIKKKNFRCLRQEDCSQRYKCWSFILCFFREQK